MKLVVVSFVALALVAGYGVGALIVPRAAESFQPIVSSEAAPFVPAEALRFEDPAGDASDDVGGDLLPCGLPALGCVGTVVAQDSRAEHLDIVSVSLVEASADEVVLTLGIASLDGGIPQLKAKDGLHRMAQYGVCWAAKDDDGCSRHAFLRAMVHDGELHATSHFEVYDEDCNEWSWCSWPVPVEIRYGAPGEMVFRVPKAWASTDGAAPRVHHVEAYTGYADEATAFPMWHPGLTVHTPLRHVHTHGGGVMLFGTADWTDAFDAGVTLSAPASEPWTALDAPLALAHPGNMHGAGSQYDYPEFDLVGYDLYEEDDALVVLIALREAMALPQDDFDYSVALGRAGGEVLEIGYRQEAGHATGYAGECIMEECQDGGLFEVDAEFVPGAPAFILVRVPRDVLAELGDPQPGDRTTLAWVSSMYTQGSQYWGEPDDAVYGDVHHAFMIDEIIGAQTYVFGSGHRAPLEAFGATQATSHEH